MATKWVDLEGLRTFKELQDNSNNKKYALKEDTCTKDELNSVVGNINTILDIINGEVI